MSSGSHETGGTAKKVTAFDSVKPGPHIHIFFLIQGLRVRVEMASISPYISKVRSHFWLKFGMVTSIYGALMLLNFCGDWGGGWGLELNFLRFQIEENFWEAKF